MSTYVRTIDHLERVASSYFGNPRYRVHFTDGHSALTVVDSGLAYALPNPEYIGVPVTVTTTSRGQIRNVEPVKS